MRHLTKSWLESDLNVRILFVRHSDAAQHVFRGYSLHERKKSSSVTTQTIARC
jgi:hypothetical protein